MRRAYWPLAILAISLAFSVEARADTLQLKNGTVVQGRYVGGSETELIFDASGRAKQHNVSCLLSITFTGVPAAAISTPPLAPPQNVAPAATPAPPAPTASVTPRSSQDDAASGNASGS